LLLLAGGLDWFDAICHTFSAVATGGFSAKNASVGHYGSAYVETTLTVFMFLASLNFALYYRAVRGDWKALFANAESRVFFWLIVAAGLAVALSLTAAGLYDGPLERLRKSFFQVVAVISTTGFSSADWEKWPHFSQGVLFLLFFVGGCSGSTSGGLKCVRWILLFKGIRRTLRQHIHPRAVLPVRLNGRAAPEAVMTAVWSFCAVYFIVIAGATLALTSMNIDLLTAFSAAACAVGNVGVGLGEVGPSGNFGSMPGAAKAVLSLCMFLGRLEFFTLLILFLPEFWRR
jgi:trk system potassium uptake protein TrkH